mmetsp:Transcript_13160/g.19357  ORF Transcript_13160/g.19357 Transcript_13160/m.19357 type:complete len:161 (-) Transcript_13160:859-1341(-)
MTYAYRLVLQDEFSFCGISEGRDKDLLACLGGLKDIFQGRYEYADNAELTYSLTGVYKGREGIKEYTRLTDGSLEDDVLLRNVCPISQNVEVLVMNVTGSYCEISSAVPIKMNVDEWEKTRQLKQSMAGHFSLLSKITHPLSLGTTCPKHARLSERTRCC